MPNPLDAVAAALGSSPNSNQPTEHYKLMTDKIQRLLSETVGRNPAATNYAFRIADEPRTNRSVNEIFHRLTNLPQTVVIDAHGRANSEIPAKFPDSFPNNPKGHFGLSPNEEQTDDLAQTIKARRDLIHKNPEVAQIADSLNGASMATIAKSLAGATNDVKRAVLLNCYRGGYDPAEIKQYFPNVEQIITSKPNEKTALGYAIPMFQEKEDPYFKANPAPAESPGEDFTLQNYSGGKTNPIHKISDWIKQLPAGMDPFSAVRQPKQ